MKKNLRQIEVLLASLKEYSEIEKVIESLPRGYVSTKVISGHTYYYRQWREGSRIISSYIPGPFVNGIRQKIIIRKENEQLLKITKKNLESAIKQVVKGKLLTIEQVDLLKEGANYDELPLSEREAFIVNKFSDASEELRKNIDAWCMGYISYNELLLSSWGF